MAVTSTPNDLLTALLPEWHLLLQEWSSSGRLTAAAQEGLLLNGEPQALTDLVTQWSAGDFTGIPPIVLLSGAEMNGAMGAYAISTGIIYLNADWLVTASKEKIFSILTEELGHSLDANLNAIDTPGDEGELFARLLSGELLSDAQKDLLKVQSDTGEILFGETRIAVENAASILTVDGVSLFGTGSNDYTGRASATSDGIYLPTFLGDRLTLVKVDFQGNQTWKREVSPYPIITGSTAGATCTDSTHVYVGAQGRVVNAIPTSYLSSYSHDGALSWQIQDDNTEYFDIKERGEILYVCGRTWEGTDNRSSQIGNGDAFIQARNKSDGSLIWYNSFGSTGNEWAPEITLLLDGIAVGIDSAGNFEGLGNSGIYDGYTGFLAYDGTPKWWSPSGVSDYDGINTTASYKNEVITAGYRAYGSDRGQAFIRSIDSKTGQTTWTTEWGDGNFQYVSDIEVIGDKLYLIVGGNAPHNASASFATTILVLDTKSGTVLDSGAYDIAGAYEDAVSFVRAGGSLYLSGATTGSIANTTNQGGTDIWIAKVQGVDIPVIRGNSYYSSVDGVTWHQGENYAISLGGHLASLNDSSEESYLKSIYQRGWIGYTDELIEGMWRWTDGSSTTYTNWQSGQPDNYGGIQDYAQVWTANGQWDDAEDDTTYTAVLYNKRAIVEVPITSSITFSPTAKEGQTLTTIINLHAGTEASGNLVDGAVVYWKVEGITAADLDSNSPNGLTGSGTIVDGKLVLNHLLKADYVIENETFQVSIYSDPAMAPGTQIGSTESVDISDTAFVPVIHGNSYYQLVVGPSWMQAESNAVSLGGHLTAINSSEEYLWINGVFSDLVYRSESAPFSDLGPLHLHWIGLFDGGANPGTSGSARDWKWSSGETYSFIAPASETATSPNTGEPYVLTNFNVPSWVTGGIQTYGFWQDYPNTDFAVFDGISELTLNCSTTFSGKADEGQILTSNIKFSVGNFYRTDLIEGAVVYWKVEGITAADLDSNSPNGLTGSGTIVDGKLVLNHALKSDAVIENENFQLSVFSDSGMTAGTQIGTTQSVEIIDGTPIVRGNSVYSVVEGPKWTVAESYSVAIGGHLTAITSAGENAFISSAFKGVDAGGGYNYLGNYDPSIQDLYWTGLFKNSSNSWRWTTGEDYSYQNWTPTNFDGNQFRPDVQRYGSIQVEQVATYAYDPSNGATWQAYADGVWNANYNDFPEGLRGIAEVPISSSITFSDNAKEGETLTTTINLHAGTEASGNLVEGALVYWKVEGITADDLESTTPDGLSGSGTIVDGNLVLNHALKIDSIIENESFQVSVYSDASMSSEVQIGTSESVAVLDVRPVIRANSVYRVVEGSSWTFAESNSGSIGGHLITINDASENNFIKAIDGWWAKEVTALYIGLYDTNNITFAGSGGTGFEHVYPTGRNWAWASGESLDYINWSSGQGGADMSIVDGPKTVMIKDSSEQGTWNDLPNDPAHEIPWGQQYQIERGIAEVPIVSSITFSDNVKEGETLTTTINLHAGTESSGNLVEGAFVYWKVEGITADDLESTSPDGLTGSGTIVNGKLVLNHALKRDYVIENETFQVSVYSDPAMAVGTQIGTTESADVEDANSNPTDITLSAYVFNENILAGSAVAMLACTDPETGDTFTYSFATGNGDSDNGAFSIDGNTLKINASPNYETKNSYAIRLRTTDAGGLLFEKAITINVDNLQEGGSIAAITSSLGSVYQEGCTLFAGSINDPDTVTGSVVYKWFKGSTEVQTGSSASFVVGAQAVGTYHVEAFYQDGTGSTVSAVSADQIVAAANNGNGTPGSITSSTSGVFQEGVTLTAPTVTGDPDGDAVSPNYAYQWYKNGTQIGGATNSTYAVSNTGAGTYKVAITYSDNQGYRVSIDSADKVVAQIDNGSATFQVSGTATVGQILTCNKVTDDADGNGTFTYQWQSNTAGTWGNIGTASTSNTYLLTASEQAKQVRVLVSYTDGQLYSSSAITTATSAVNPPPDTVPPTIVNSSVQGNSIALTFSESVQSTGPNLTSFVVRVAGTSRAVTGITFDSVNRNKYTLTLSGTAPKSSQSLTISYAGTGTNVVKDTAGNSMAAFTNVPVDTFVSSATVSTLYTDYKNLTLAGSSAINATGNTKNNTILGNTGANSINGGAGADTLTGLAGVDTFVCTTLTNSLLGTTGAYTYDRITDFAIGTDRIDGPSAVSALALRELGSVATLNQAGIAAVLTTANFVANGAATFSFGSSTFLALNNGTAGFSSTTDAVVDITGFTGLLTNLSIV